MLYFDYAATTPIAEDALSAYIKASQDFFGNAASLHDEGSRALHLLEHCRQTLAQLIGVKKEGLYFTGSGTESNLLAILSLALASKGDHIITSAAEHTSVHAAIAFLEQQGYAVTKLPLNRKGIIEEDRLYKAIRPTTALVTLQYVNQEIGTIQPIQRIGTYLKERKIPFHSDFVQAFGKLPLQEISSFVDSFSISAHKIFGPKGVGAVYIHPSVLWDPMIPHLTHEKGFRGGTVDIPAIAAFVAAAETRCHTSTLGYEWSLRSQLKQQLQATPYEWIESNDDTQLPSIIGCKLAGIEGQFMMLKLNEAGICVSTGSACDVRVENGMKAIQAMGYSMEEARQFFRISFSHLTTESEIDQLATALQKITSNQIVHIS